GRVRRRCVSRWARRRAGRRPAREIPQIPFDSPPAETTNRANIRPARDRFTGAACPPIMSEAANPTSRQPLVWAACALVAIAAALTVRNVGFPEGPPPGLEQRPEARPYLGLPATPSFPRAGNWITEPAFPQ